MRIIVTGGAGFIGSAVCRALVGRGIPTMNVDKLTYAANLQSLEPVAGKPGYEFRKADICDADAMRAAFAEFKPTAILHLAAESHVDRSISGSAAFVETNVVGTYRLLEAARNYCAKLTAAERDAFRFVHISTDEVYGSLGPEGRFREDSVYAPSSPYSASKAASDHFAHAWFKTYALPVIVTNCSNNYGPYQFPEKLIPLMILNALERKPLPVYGDGSNVRDWLFVDDHVEGLLAALSLGRPGESYNFGGAAELTNLSVVERICDLVDAFDPGKPSRRNLITLVADRPGHDRRYAMDAGKAQRELGWRPRETFDSGLRRTVRWYLDRRDWWTPLRERVYAGERLGLLSAP